MWILGGERMSVDMAYVVQSEESISPVLKELLLDFWRDYEGYSQQVRYCTNKETEA